MIIGLGIDIAEVARFARQLPGLPGLREDLFTPAEIAYCEPKADPASHYAARFAAKEAFLKALGTGWRDGLAFGDIEVAAAESAGPTLSLKGRAASAAAERQVRRIHLSLSHEASHAVAIVILEG